MLPRTTKSVTPTMLRLQPLRRSRLTAPLRFRQLGVAPVRPSGDLLVCHVGPYASAPPAGRGQQHPHSNPCPMHMLNSFLPARRCTRPLSTRCQRAGHCVAGAAAVVHTECRRNLQKGTQPRAMCVLPCPPCTSMPPTMMSPCQWTHTKRCVAHDAWRRPSVRQPYHQPPRPTHVGLPPHRSAIALTHPCPATRPPSR